jgi:tetratricopeptide (TPR) repeat protein
MRPVPAWVFLTLLLVGCREAPAPVAAAPATRPATDPRTTSGSIALRNLSAQIDGQSKLIERQPQCAPCRIALADLLMTRAQVTGAVSDLEKALALAEEAVRLQPDGATLLGRARAKAGFHLFVQARADVARARTLGAPPEEVEAATAGLDEATGALETALHLREAAVARGASTLSWGHRAVVLAALGRPIEASAEFARAKEGFRDVNPLPIAWLELQEALAWQAAGDLSRARELLRRAHKRLPQSLPVASHLAAIAEDPDEAIALLEPFVDAEDPEPAGQLAELYLLRRDPAVAKALAARTEQRFDALLSRHPEAYADHAARFFLGAGASPARALTWAQRNLENRPTAVAMALVLDAARAAGDTRAACLAASRVRETPGVDSYLRANALRVLADCGKSPL